MSDLVTFMAMVLAGPLCGFVDSSLGMGHGVSATSVFLASGISPAIASASVHASEREENPKCLEKRSEN